jgi:hypothetical protein
LSLGVGAVAASILFAATDVRADEERPLPQSSSTASTAQNQAVSWRLGGRATYVSPPIRGGTSPFGAGFGGAIALVVSHVYVGASVVYFLGGSDVSISDHALTYGLELGYEIELVHFGNGNLLLRPQVGGGGAALYHTDPSTAKVDVVTSASGRSSTSTSSDTTTVNAFYVEPGATLLFAMPSFFAGVNANTMYLPSVSYGPSTSAAGLSYGARAELGFLF